MAMISARTMQILDWLIKEAATKLGTMEIDSGERKEFASRLRGARDALAEIRTVRKELCQEDQA